jgi:hypothetical protein
MGRPRKSLTLEEIRLWIQNDEGLYNWQRASGLPLARFIRENRQELEAAIQSVLTGVKPCHYQAYGPEAGRYPSRR